MKKLIAILMILALVMGMAACGSPASGSASVADSAPAASDADSTPEEDDGLAMTGGDVEGHTVEAIKAKGVLVVTTEAGYAPFEFLDENDNIVGLDASLAQALADDLGVALDMQNIAFDSVVAEVQAGNADMAIAGLTPNNDRKKSVDMSDMYYEGGQCMLVRAEDVEPERRCDGYAEGRPAGDADGRAVPGRGAPAAAGLPPVCCEFSERRLRGGSDR